jgi:hypothetical protein
MWSCKQRGIMLLLTLGNLWNAYKGPEDFLAMATGTAGESQQCVSSGNYSHTGLAWCFGAKRGVCSPYCTLALS